jgi:hypothetical protein
MFYAYQDNKPAKYGFDKFRNNIFETFEDAKKYMVEWISNGDYIIPDNWNGDKLKFENVSRKRWFDLDSFEIEIRKE